MTSGQSRHVIDAAAFLRRNIAQKRAHLIVGSEARQRSAKLPQSRNMAEDNLQMGVNDSANVVEEDELYNPCGEAVHLKNTV